VHGTAATARARRLPVVLALALVVLGVIATLVRLDAPSDGSVLWFGSSTWSAPTDKLTAGGIRDGHASRHRCANR